MAAAAWNAGAPQPALRRGPLAQRRSPASSPRPGGPAADHRPDGRTPARSLRPALPRQRPAQGGPGDQRPGPQRARTRQAIETLRPRSPSASSVYAEGLQGWIDMARANGHEVLLETPMEPLDYPDNDPGPYTLMTDAQPPETVKKLEWILSRATGYFGLTNYLGSHFLADDKAYEAFASGVRGRGLAFVDDGSAARRGGASRGPRPSGVIDDKLSGPAIDQQLMALEGGALPARPGPGAPASPIRSRSRRLRVGPMRWNRGAISSRLFPRSWPSDDGSFPVPPERRSRALPPGRPCVAGPARRHGRALQLAVPAGRGRRRRGPGSGRAPRSCRRRPAPVGDLPGAHRRLDRLRLPADLGGSKAGAGFKGQKQVWFAFRFDGRGQRVRPGGPPRTRVRGLALGLSARKPQT
jgi:hypothetical protein